MRPNNNSTSSRRTYSTYMYVRPTFVYFIYSFEPDGPYIYIPLLIQRTSRHAHICFVDMKSWWDVMKSINITERKMKMPYQNFIWIWTGIISAVLNKLACQNEVRQSRLRGAESGGRVCGHTHQPSVYQRSLHAKSVMRLMREFEKFSTREKCHEFIRHHLFSGDARYV